MMLLLYFANSECHHCCIILLLCNLFANSKLFLFLKHKVYWPKREDVVRCLKVECTLILNGAEFPPIFAVSLPVSPGTLKAYLIK